MEKVLSAQQISERNRKPQPCKTKTLLARLEKCTSTPCFILAPRLCGQDELLEAFCKKHAAPLMSNALSSPANPMSLTNTSNAPHTSGTASFVATFEVASDGSLIFLEQNMCAELLGKVQVCSDFKTACGSAVAYVPFVPWLDDSAAQKFSDNISSMLEEGQGVIVSCPPQNDRYCTLQGNRIEISAQELKQCGLMSTRLYPLSLKQFLCEFLPLHVRLIAILSAVLGQTNLEELKRLGYELSSDLPFLLEGLHPLFTATPDGRGIRAEHLPIQEMSQQLQQILHEHLEERGQQVSISLLASRVTALSIALLEKGDLESSHQVLHIAEELISDGVAQKSSGTFMEALPSKTLDLYHVCNHRAHPVHPLEGVEYAATITSAQQRRPRSEQEQFLTRQSRSTCVKPSAPLLQLRLFGNLRVYCGGVPLIYKYLSRTKIRRLLSFLALNQQRAVSRDTLIEYLWPYLDFERAQKNLYTSWCMLAKGLGSESVKDCPYIQRNGETYQLNASLVTCDTQLFENSARGILFETPDREAQTGRLYELEELYCDSLVADIPADGFIQAKMEGYRCLMVDSLLLTTRQLRYAKELEKALYYARAAYELDETREDVYRELMDTQLEAGQRTSAMQTYFSCKRYLSDELGILPSKSTTALYQDLLLDNCR